ncbi:hypothetical protein CXF85_09555 [Colwellia sp. 75C3]|uniref:DUF5666 domain-containing protein n=1 Tax=Colwellia sp. 75C3 TaxID=888425 RepID=UPI000C31F72D|nr:DUF5666 domain-containing protein [Colwellia sp. 75C3]PKG83744.1 hypothetical protein CXF85_09555 [Colwellia sp. 75C3]
MQHKFTAIAGLASLCLFLSACTEEDAPVTYITSSGVISGFGSVYVNGVRYITKDSNIIGNGNKSDEASLKVGMKVVINAQKSSDFEPTAQDVKYLADAIGTVDAIDLANNSLSILGQTYLITQATQFDDTRFSELRTDMIVELSAFKNEYGNFVVSYLAIKDAQTEQQLTGTISDINKVNKTFTIGELVVSYEDADITGMLTSGSLVEVKSKFPPINNKLVADKINALGLLLYIDGLLEVTGIVEDFDKAGNTIIIKVDGRKYVLSDATDFSQGDKDDLKIGSQVSLVATVVESESITDTPNYPVNNIRLELANEISLEGIVELISDDSFTLFGQEFTVDNYTQYEDDSEQDLRNFNFTNIAIGDKLAIDAYEDNGVLISRKVDREETGGNDQESHEIEGVVDNIDLPSFSVKGIIVLTNEETDFEDAQGNDVDQDTFFLKLKEQDEVEVELTKIDNDWLALAVEIDNGDTELLGTIDNFTNRFSFTVNGHDVVTNMHTKFENGSVNDLVLNAKIEVEGTVNSDGQLVADEIEFIEINAN